MKKISLIMASIICILSMGISATANTIDNKDIKTVDNKEAGISFNISENWIQLDEEGMKYRHNHNSDQWERLSISVLPIDNAFMLEIMTDVNQQTSDYERVCQEVYSDYNLAQSLSEINNNVDVTIETHSVLSSFETINGVKYYRYEKAYMAKAYGYNDAPFYLTAFITAKNGKLYAIEYARNEAINNFTEVVDLLDSMSYANGEIKIMVNNKRLYPDSAPVILEDRTLVPIRVIAERLGYSVEWNGGAQEVLLRSQNGKTTISVVIGRDYALKNGAKVPLDVPAMIIRERTYLPLRAVAEAMNARVAWNGNEYAVKISY